ISLLLVIAGVRLTLESSKREAAEKALGEANQRLKQTGEVLAEVRALRNDVNEVAVGLKTLAQKRSDTGEKRRENIKTELAGDKCAAVPVPDRVADSLYQRAAEVSAGDYSGTFAGKPDGKN
ncbi:TPA: DUF2570 domain-containing protein, partial [Enterobacter kobei]